MEGIKWLFGYGDEELPPSSLSSDGGDDYEDVSAMIASMKSDTWSDTSDQQIAEEWCVVVEGTCDYMVKTIHISICLSMYL